MVTIYTNNLYMFIAQKINYIIAYLNDNNEKINDGTIQNAARDMIASDYNDLKNALSLFDNVYNVNNKILVVGSWTIGRGCYAYKKYFNSLYDAIMTLSIRNNTIYFKNKNSTMQLEVEYNHGINNYKFYAVVKGKKQAIKLNDIINCY